MISGIKEIAKNINTSLPFKERKKLRCILDEVFIFGYLNKLACSKYLGI